MSPYHVIPVGDRSAADLLVLVLEASRSGEVMIVSVPSAFQVRSLQRLVKLQTGLSPNREPVHRLYTGNVWEYPRPRRALVSVDVI